MIDKKLKMVLGFIALSIIVIALPFIFNLYHQRKTIRTVKLIKSDLRSLATSIEARAIDECCYLYPDEAFTPGSVYAQRYGMDMEILTLLNELPKLKRRYYLFKDYKNLLRRYVGEQPVSLNEDEERIYAELDEIFSPQKYIDMEENRIYQFASLTTPVAYYKVSHKKRSEMGNRPLFKDPFNDDDPGVYRYGTLFYKDRHLQEFWILLSHGPDRDADLYPEYVDQFNMDQPSMTMVYNDFPFEGQPKPMVDYIYDPTNGHISDGDIIRIKQ